MTELDLQIEDADTLVARSAQARLHRTELAAAVRWCFGSLELGDEPQTAIRYAGGRRNEPITIRRDPDGTLTVDTVQPKLPERFMPSSTTTTLEPKSASELNPEVGPDYNLYGTLVIGSLVSTGLRPEYDAQEARDLAELIYASTVD